MTIPLLVVHIRFLTFPLQLRELRGDDTIPGLAENGLASPFSANPYSTSHTCSVLSPPPEAMRKGLVGDHATAYTQLECPG